MEEVSLVRDILEATLPAEVVSDALERAIQSCAHGTPRNAAEVRSLVAGPLRRELNLLVGAEACDAVLNLLEEMFADEEAEDEEVEVATNDAISSYPVTASFDVDIDFSLDEDGDEMASLPVGRVTTSLPTVRHMPVPVLITSGSDGLARSLDQSLGARLVKVIHIEDVGGISRAVFSASPLLVVVDADDPPAGAQGVLIEATRRLPLGVLLVLWGSETPMGRHLGGVFDKESINAIGVESEHGVEALGDLIASRQS
ncbi:MAG: hypothetical protein AAF355_13960 [Myxococcota bacterium]